MEQIWLREGDIVVRKDVFDDRIPKQQVIEAFEYIKSELIEHDLKEGLYLLIIDKVWKELGLDDEK